MVKNPFHQKNFRQKSVSKYDAAGGVKYHFNSRRLRLVSRFHKKLVAKGVEWFTPTLGVVRQHPHQQVEKMAVVLGTMVALNIYVRLISINLNYIKN